jgi:uncharacterized membrane protein SirB2
MPYQVYKLIHFLGIFSVIIALSIVSVMVMRGSTKADMPYRRQLGMVHGLGMLFILVGGFGMMARLGLTSGMPGWIIAKLVIWLIVGSAMTFIYRGAGVARAYLLALPFVAALAAFFALYKPF